MKLSSARSKYRTDPEFRRRKIERVRANEEKHANDPDWLRLVQLRKDISRIRGSIADRLDHAARLERRLIELVKEKLELEAKRKGRNAG